MAYAYLFAAILLEISGTFCLKLSNGFEKPLPSALAFTFYFAMNIPLIFAMKALPLSMVYAIWAGVGVVAAACIGFTYFGEAATPARLSFLLITVVGISGLMFNMNA